MGKLDFVPVVIDPVQTLALNGYGHFTTMRVDGGSVRGLTLHLTRLAQDCETLFGKRLDLDSVRGHLRSALGDTTEPVIARVTIFDPMLDPSLSDEASKPRILVTIRHAPAMPQTAIRVKPFSYVRQMATIKHVGLFESQYLRRRAQAIGFDDALFMSSTGIISEGSTWNIGFYDGKQVVWPDASQLHGVTRTLLRQTSVPHAVRKLTLGQLNSMEAAFATNSVSGVRPITAIGPTHFPARHPILDHLTAAYDQIIPEKLYGR